MHKPRHLTLAIALLLSVTVLVDRPVIAGTIYSGCSGYDACAEVFGYCNTKHWITNNYDFTNNTYSNGGMGLFYNYQICGKGTHTGARKMRNRMRMDTWYVIWNSNSPPGRFCVALPYDSRTWVTVTATGNRNGSSTFKPVGCQTA